jgi:hypothetical protein
MVWQAGDNNFTFIIRYWNSEHLATLLIRFRFNTE